MVWITILQDGMKKAEYPMPGVPRVGDIIDLMPMVIRPEGKYVEVVRVVWNVPEGFTDAQLVELEEADLPGVWLYVRPVTFSRRSPASRESAE